MTHSEILKTVAKQYDTTPKEIDKIIETYLLEVAKAAKADLEEKRKGMTDKNILRRSASVTNKNIGSFWVKYDRGENGKNALGGQEKDFYLRLKVRFSKSFYEKLEK